MGNIWAAIGRGKRKNRSVVQCHHCTASQCTASLLYSFVFDLWQQVLFCSLGLPQTPGLLALLFWWSSLLAGDRFFIIGSFGIACSESSVWELCLSLHGRLCDSLVWFYSTTLTIRAEFVSPIDESGIQLLPSVYPVDLDMLPVL